MANGWTNKINTNTMKFKFNLREFMIGFSFTWIVIEILKRIFA